jgi:hypothetical protein
LVFFNFFFFLEKQNEANEISSFDSSINDLSLKQPTSLNDQSTVVKITNTENDEEHLKSSSISMKRIFANFLPSSSFQPLKLPFPEEEHFILNCESNYFINEKDLSSIVAFTLR